MEKMSFTKAYNTAQKAVGKPVRTGQHSWQITYPFSYDITGPSTTTNKTSYAAAQVTRKVLVAEFGAALMGRLDAANNIMLEAHEHPSLTSRELMARYVRD